ncbi:hypothetical protein ABKN59_000878 [Abortiporus biennis]
MTSTTTDTLCTRWTRITDEHLTLSDIEHILTPIPDDLWVAAACVDRVVDDAILEKSLLVLGINRTEQAKERSLTAYREGSSLNNSEEDVAGMSSWTEEQRKSASLVTYYTSEPSDARLCQLRAVLLDRLDRLNTFVEIWRPKSLSSEDDIDAEWEDDPWADDEAAMEKFTDGLVGEPPITLSSFLLDPLLQSACLFASSELFSPICLLLVKHGPALWPYRFAILNCIPEHVCASEYRSLLPALDNTTEQEVKVTFDPWRPEQDWVESKEVHIALLDLNVSPVEGVPSLDYRCDPAPLSSRDLSAWYRGRIDDIMGMTGMVDIALSLVQHAAAHGVMNLDELGEDLSLFSRLVYDAAKSPEGVIEEDLTFAQWKSMDPSAVVHAYLAHSTPDTIIYDINRLVMPYLFVLESRAERSGHPDSELPLRMLYNFILEASLEIVATVFDASKPTLSPAQRVIKDDEDMARLALACLYGSDSLDEWSTMSRIFECLPAWDTPESDDQADEAEMTLSSLGTFVIPTTTRPRCTPSDLLLFFKPLPFSSLSKALDVLDVHLESGEILSRWGVPAPLRWFLQSNSNISEQRAWSNRMARRAGEGGEKLETQDDWEWLLEDMLKLAGSGDSGLGGAFCLLSRDDVSRIFFSGLLSTGNFQIAKDILHSHKSNLHLDADAVEAICLTCSQEFYDNASSGNLHFGEMKLAYECLNVPPPTPRLLKEKEFIEATSRLCSFNLQSRPGIPISPIEIRLTQDKLSLVSQLLSSNTDAYKHSQVILDLVNMLGFKDDAVAEVKTLAMLADSALQAEDFDRAYEACDQMVDNVLKLKTTSTKVLPNAIFQHASEVCWVECFQLGRQPEFEDVPKKLTLLGRALELCPADKMVDILNSWNRLEVDDLETRKARKSGNRPLHEAHHKASAVETLAARLEKLHMPDLHLSSVNPDAAAFANKAFSRVAANFPFGVSGRGRTLLPNEGDRSRSSDSSRSRRYEGAEVSAQATRVLQKGIGWLLGDDD